MRLLKAVEISVSIPNRMYICTYIDIYGNALHDLMCFELSTSTRQ